MTADCTLGKVMWQAREQRASYYAELGFYNPSPGELPADRAPVTWKTTCGAHLQEFDPYSIQITH